MLDKILQLNRAASEEMTISSEDLSTQASVLINSISFFHVNGREKDPGPDVENETPLIAN